MHFDDAGGFDSGPQDILFGRLIIFGAESLQIVQEAEGTRHRTRSDVTQMVSTTRSTYICIYMYIHTGLWESTGVGKRQRQILFYRNETQSMGMGEGVRRGQG